MLQDVIDTVRDGGDPAIPIEERSPNLNAEVCGLVADQPEKARVRNLIPSGIDRTIVSNLESFEVQLSKNSAVVVLSLTFDEAEIRRLIHRALTTSKHIQIALFGRQEATAETLPHDAHFHPPFDVNAGQQRMARLYIRAYFSSTLEAFYQLNIQALNHEMRDPGRAEEGARLERIEKSRALLRRHLGEFTSYLDADDIQDLSLSQGDVAESTTALESRFDPRTLGLPPACPECDLTFEEYHGEDLGDGYEKIAAKTYRCTRCSHVINVSESAQRFIS